MIIITRVTYFRVNFYFTTIIPDESNFLLMYDAGIILGLWGLIGKYFRGIASQSTLAAKRGP